MEKALLPSYIQVGFHTSDSEYGNYILLQVDPRMPADPQDR